MFTAGGYDIDRFAWNHTLTWNYLIDDLSWTVSLKEASLGDHMITMKLQSALIDSGTSFLAMPETDLRSFADFLNINHGFNFVFIEETKIYASECELS